MEAVQTKPNGKKRSPVLMPERCGLAEEKRRDFVVDVEVGVTPEELLEPSFWTHVAPTMSAFDTIEARCEDGSYIAYLRVIYAERNYAKVACERLFKVEEKIDTSQPVGKHRIEWKGPKMRFAVIRNNDAEVIKAEFQTRELATAYMIEHERTVG